MTACYADVGPTLKRWRPRARGRATRILKRTCHITIIVTRYDEATLETMRERDAAKGRVGSSAHAAEARRQRVERSRAAAAEEAAAEEAAAEEAAAEEAAHDHDHDEVVADAVSSEDSETAAGPDTAEASDGVDGSVAEDATDMDEADESADDAEKEAN